MSIPHLPVEVQTSPQENPSLPCWFGEVALVASYLNQLGGLEAINQQVRQPRGRMGHYQTIDFVALLLGYAISSEPTLQAFFERLQPFATPFMALFGRERMPHRSTLSRFLSSLEEEVVEPLRTLFQHDLFARALPGSSEGGLWDRMSRQWSLFDLDGTRATARQRALPHLTHAMRNERVEGVTRPEKGRYSLAHTLSVVSMNTIQRPEARYHTPDIADTSVRIQTSAEDRLFEKRARSEKFFSVKASKLVAKKHSLILWRCYGKRYYRNDNVAGRVYE